MGKAATRRPSINIREFEQRLRGPQPVDARKEDPFEELERMLYAEKEAAAAEPEAAHFDEEASQQSSAPSPTQIAHSAEPPHEEDDVRNDETRDSHGDAVASAIQPERHYEDKTDYHDNHADWPKDESRDYLDFGMQEDEQSRSAREEDEGKFRFPKFRPRHAALGVAALAIASAGLTFAYYSRGGTTAEIEAALTPNTSAIAYQDESAPERKIALNREAPRPQPVDAGPLDAPPHQPSDGSALAPDTLEMEQMQPETAYPTLGVGADLAFTSPHEPKFAVNSADANADLATAAASADPTATHGQSAGRKAEKLVSALETENDAPTRSGGRGSFEVRLGSADTPAKARKLMEQIASKFGSQFGGNTIGYRHATVDDKKVYLVRLRRNLGRDAAAGVCERVTSSGGSCAVAEK